MPSLFFFLITSNYCNYIWNIWQVNQEDQVRSNFCHRIGNKGYWINKVNHVFNMTLDKWKLLIIRELSIAGQTRPRPIPSLLFCLIFPSSRVESPAAPLISSSDLTGIDSESNNNILSGVGCYNEMNPYPYYYSPSLFVFNGNYYKCFHIS